MSDSERTSELSLTELKTWKVADLKLWLEKRKLKKSGVKDILIKRVFRAMTYCPDIDISSSDDDSLSDGVKSNVLPIHLISNPWKPLDFTDIPGISSKDVDSYFLYHKSPLTGDSYNFERQMIKAKRLCNEGFVREIEFNKIEEDSPDCYIRSKCLPSMRQTVQIGNLGKMAKHYTLHVRLTKKTGHIASAKCDCKAGDAGLCAHVGALLYTLVKTKDACTSTNCTWDRPRPLEKKPSPKRVCDITFSKTEKDKQSHKIRPLPGVYTAGPVKDEGNLFLKDILNGLESVYPECILFQTLRAEHANIEPFLDVFSTEFMIMDNVNIKSDTYQDIFSSFVQDMTVSQEICLNLEKATRGQHSNFNWRRARSFLITASVMGEVCKRVKTVPDNLIKKLCGYITVPDNVKSLKYGRAYESVAIGDYMQDHLKKCDGEVNIELCGLQVNPKYPYLGASIDGLISCAKCGTGVVEVKCPYGSDSHGTPWRNCLPIECAKDATFCCVLHDKRLKVKENHNYMYQIQGQMAILELDWADFVIWTKKGIHIERVKFSEHIWGDMVKKLKRFYTSSVVAELFTRRVERGKPLH